MSNPREPVLDPEVVAAYQRVRGFIVDEIGKRCGQIPDIHPRLLEGINAAAVAIVSDREKAQ